MGILSFTDKDKMVSKIMPAAYYSAQVVQIGDATLSSTKKSYNMHSQFRIIDDKNFDGKELKVTFNTNMDTPGCAGTMYLMPHTYILHVAAAVDNIELNDVPNDIDTDKLKEGKLDIKVEKIISDGVVMNTISAFLPYGKGKAAEKETSPF